MQAQNLSLTHLVVQPREAGGAHQPPLLVMLHGVGSNEQDLISLAQYLDPRLLCISVRAPHTYAYGGFAWFEINWQPNGFTMDPVQVAASWVRVQQFVREAVAAYNVDPQRVYLAGFSQGAIISLGATLTAPDLVAGLVVMSGRWMPEAGPQADVAAISGLPILAVHGLYDEVIPVRYGRAIRDYLKSLPVDLTYHEYPMAHQVSMESLRDIAGWLKNRLDAPRRTTRPADD